MDFIESKNLSLPQTGGGGQITITNHYTINSSFLQELFEIYFRIQRSLQKIAAFHVFEGCGRSKPLPYPGMT
jgi:hypothetical protein